MNIPRNLSDAKLMVANFNGWQRLYVLFVIIWTIVCLADLKLMLPNYVNVNDKVQYGNYVSANFDKYLPKKRSSFEEFLNPTSALMSDGIILPLYGNTKEEVAEAYEKFKSDPQNLNPNEGYFFKVIKEIVSLLLMYSLPLIGVYFFGWLIGWVIKGFKKQV